jgi:hypothetical protein
MRIPNYKLILHKKAEAAVAPAFFMKVKITYIRFSLILALLPLRSRK